MKAIGLIEFRSIARGIETADVMVKIAPVKLLRSATICPGKFLILIAGDTSSVQEAVNAGINKGVPYVVGDIIIPNVDPKVIQAIEGFSMPTAGKAIGILEYYAVIDAVSGADIAVKAANVDIIEIRLGFAIGGKAFVTLTGDVAEIEASIKAAKEDNSIRGMLMESCMIPSIDPSVYDKLL